VLKKKEWKDVCLPEKEGFTDDVKKSIANMATARM
jgi:hypothetical protein